MSRTELSEHSSVPTENKVKEARGGIRTIFLNYTFLPWKGSGEVKKKQHWVSRTKQGREQRLQHELPGVLPPACGHTY